jgi:iron(III) transport system substrate-binding protein
VNRRSAATVAALCAVSILAGSGCGGPSPDQPTGERLASREVVVYVSADDAVARPLLAAFERETGIRVRARYDTEASKATALAAMLRSERNAPRADCVWSGEALTTAALASEGILAPHRGRRADSVADGCRGQSGRWYAFAARPRVLVYRPSVVDPAALPTSWMDVAHGSWSGTLAMADPRFGTTRGHLIAMSLLPDGVGDAWIEALAARRPLVRSGGNAAVVDAVWRGEATIGMTDEDDVRAARAQGADVECIVLPVGDGSADMIGAVVTPATIGTVAGAPHPTEAAAFMEWMLGPRVEAWLAASRSGNAPLADPDGARAVDTSTDWPEGLERGDPYRCAVKGGAAVIDWDGAAQAGDAALVRFMSLVRQGT